MAKVVKPKKISASDIDLNRWCIEQAMRWPVISTGGYGQAGAYGSMPRHDADADIIGRANKLMAWIKQSH